MFSLRREGLYRGRGFLSELELQRRLKRLSRYFIPCSTEVVFIQLHFHQVGTQVVSGSFPEVIIPIFKF